MIFFGLSTFLNAEFHLCVIPWGTTGKRVGVQVPLQHQSQMEL